MLQKHAHAFPLTISTSELRHNLKMSYAYWYRQNSRGMVQTWSLLAIQRSLADDQTASELTEWANSQFALTAMQPADKACGGCTTKRHLKEQPHVLPEDENPLAKLLMDVSLTQTSIQQNHSILTNRVII